MNKNNSRPKPNPLTPKAMYDKNGFTNNSKPNYKAKGSATKLTSHRRGKV